MNDVHWSHIFSSGIFEFKVEQIKMLLKYWIEASLKCFVIYIQFVLFWDIDSIKNKKSQRLYELESDI